MIGGYRGTIPQHVPNKDGLIVSGYVSVADMNRYLCSCDLLWLPLCDTLANRGRWPMKINDYMCSGRPVISTTVGDWTRLFRDPLPIGRLAVDTPESIAEQSKALLSDPETAEAYGQNGRERAVNEFAWKLVTEKLYQFYEERITAEAARNNA